MPDRRRRGQSKKGQEVARPKPLPPPQPQPAQLRRERTLAEILADARRLPDMIFAAGDPRIDLVGHAMNFRGSIAENEALWELRKMEALMDPGRVKYGQRILEYRRVQEEERSSRQVPAIPAARGKFKLPPAVLAEHMERYPRSSGLSGEDRVKILFREHGVKITRSALVKRLRDLPT